ncbi:uncharacterized protein LOC134233419 [Saccostrea cucullata]|uniref:uncharacterized protein LOC134233419 n=1 Tax=Saccostrea cuccullata TaxID=36930 RepID=UPI002ED170B1
MSGLMSHKLDELFTALTQNTPITNTLIKQAKQEYSRIRDVAIRGEQGRSSAEVMKCPHCKKDLPLQRQTKLIDSENEITRLRQELQLKISMCQDLEDKIQRLQTMQKRSNSNLGGDTLLQISEIYSRLFAEQWLQAYEFMDNNLNQREDKVLDILQRILRAAYEFCKDIADAQIKNVEGEIYCPLSTWTEDKRLEFSVTPRSKTSSISSLAKQYRDMASSECIPILQETFLKEVLPEFLDVQYVNEPVVVRYTQKCVEVTWYMCIQLPQLHLVTKVIRKSTFDTKLFSYYTMAGDKIDFVVWPAVIQGENERIVSKGVAQALDNNRSHSSVKASIYSHQTEKSPQPQEHVTPQQQGHISPAGSLNNPALRGTPWGSQFYGSNRGTPSVDLPPTPTEDPPSSPKGVTKVGSRVSVAVPEKSESEAARSKMGKSSVKPQNSDTEQAKSRRASIDKQRGTVNGNPKSPKTVLESPVPQSKRGTAQRDSRYSPPLETMSLTTAWRESRAQPMSKPGKS